MTKTLTLSQSQTYMWSALFIAANIALPHLFHLIPGGGVMFLPIYFFTLIGAMRYGWQLGFLTAVMTPIVGNLIFGAPAAAMLPDMLVKGAALSLVGAFVAKKWGVKFVICLGAVVAAFVLVGLVELPFMGAAYAFQDFVTGLPGMAMMTLGAWLTSKYIK
ncbi:MAG: ECF transporter S component [Bacteroidales bacterium]|nr:ECF transporter S component [Bacteroidales bacterium]